MTERRDTLDRIEIASPCTQDWNAMTGDEKRRFCGECRLHVHDLSQMTRREADDLLRGADGRVCVRFYRRPDGRVMTKDCVTVRERLQRRVRRLRIAAAALFAFVSPFVSGCGGTPAPGTGGGEGGDPVVAPEDQPLMGDICVEEAPEGGAEPVMGSPQPEHLIGRVAPAEGD